MKTKSTILIITVLFALSVTMSAQTKSRYETMRAKFMELHKDSKFIGVGMALPDLRNDWKSTAPWMGLNVNLWESMSFYWYRGEAERLDANGNAIRGVGYMGGYGASIPFPVFSNKNTNLFPYIEFGANWKYLQDYSLVDNTDNVFGEGQQIGFGLNPGVSLRLGPVQLRAQYNLSAGYSFNKTNAFAPFTAFPSVTISLSSLPLLLNPREFTAPGVQHYIDDFKSHTFETTSFKGDVKTTTKTTHSSWTDKWRETTFSVKDVRPFIFLGPRAASTFYINDDFTSSNNLGANVGFKSGYLWVNGFYEKGSIAFHQPNKMEQLYLNYGGSIPKLSGEFENSSRYGAQVGFDMVVLIQKSDFVAYNSEDQHKINTATSNYSIIPFAGYGIANFGNFTWDSPSGATDYATYSTANAGTLQPQDVASKQKFINYGLQFHVGALAVGFTRYNYLTNKKSRQLNNWQVDLSWNIPVVRMANSLKVVNMDARLKRKYKQK